MMLKSISQIASRRFSIRAALGSRGDSGSGVGHGGGTGGSIRDAGGKFGELESARENYYFKHIENEQLDALAKKHEEEIKYHEEEIRKHMDAIKRNREVVEKNKK